MTEVPKTLLKGLPPTPLPLAAPLRVTVVVEVDEDEDTEADDAAVEPRFVKTV